MRYYANCPNTSYAKVIYHSDSGISNAYTVWFNINININNIVSVLMAC